MPPDYYETPVNFSIETWADVGTSEGAVAAADLRNTLHFGFTVLDSEGHATDIPVYFTLAAVPEPATGWMALGGLLSLAAWRRAARRIQPAARPPK